MSWGYVRKQSPRSIADARRRRAGARFKLLHDMTISEVSSVDRAANPGARVTLIKRDEVREWDGRGPPLGNRGYRFTKGNDMANSISDRIQKSYRAALEGAITWGEAAAEQMDRAQEMFPAAKTTGEALAKYMQTEVGRNDINNLHKAQFVKAQWDGRLGDGVKPGAVLKATSPKIHLDDSGDGVPRGDQSARYNDGDVDNAEPWDKRVERVMSERGCSKDAAISHLHRAEKVAKGF
jgi:hypothetical protein